MSRKYKELTTILSAVGATGSGTTVDVSKFTHIVLEVATASSASFTAKIAGAISDARPDFGAAVTPANAFDYVGAYNLNSGAFIAGDTGVVYTGTDAVELLLVNVDMLKWLNVDVTAFAAGAITIKALGADNG